MEERLLIKAKTNKFLSFAQWFPLIILIIGCLTVMVAYSHIFEDIFDMKDQYSTHIHTEWCSETAEGDILYTEDDYKEKSNIYSSYHEFVVSEIANSEYTYENYGDSYLNCTLLHYVTYDNYCDHIIQWYISDIIEVYSIFVVISIIIAIVIFILKFKLQYKIKVYNTKIHLKKCCKNSVINFDDVIEIKSDNNRIFIVTDDKNIKLSLSKKEYHKLLDVFNLVICDKIITKPVENEIVISNDDIKLF